MHSAVTELTEMTRSRFWDLEIDENTGSTGRHIQHPSISITADYRPSITADYEPAIPPRRVVSNDLTAVSRIVPVWISSIKRRLFRRR